MFDRLRAQAPDALLALIGQFAADPRSTKIDLGVGVYRDGLGQTPVFSAVKAAEQILLDDQISKAYLGPEGDEQFTARLAPVVFGARYQSVFGDRLAGLQTPGGTGALRLASDLIRIASPSAAVWLGSPSWPNHAPIFAAAGLATKLFSHFDDATRSFRFEATMEALEAASPGDAILIHGCCHNPTGVGPTLSEWREIAACIGGRGLIPLVDLAYQGLGEGLEDDAEGMRLVIDAADQAIIAYSCDKNFGLYRERTGALFVIGRTASAAAAAYSNLLAIARATYSMPPDHGASVVRIILESARLRQNWVDELETMRLRLAAVRRDVASIAAPDGPLGGLDSQIGMFSLLPLEAASIIRLREDDGIYMAASGRINVAGLRADNVPRFVEAVERQARGEAAR